MTPDQQLASLTAAFLRSARGLAGFGWLLCLIAGLGALDAAMHGNTLVLLLHALALACGFALAWQSLRMRFDIAAFELIARDEGPALANFDLALKRLGLRDGSDVRALEQRAAATRKMVTRLALIVLLEFLLVLAGLLTRHA
ncbi:MAG: hypothetical protein QM776_09375 [Rhodocyclaceae bacterium]